MEDINSVNFAFLNSAYDWYSSDYESYLFSQSYNLKCAYDLYSPAYGSYSYCQFLKSTDRTIEIYLLSQFPKSVDAFKDPPKEDDLSRERDREPILPHPV